MDTILEDDTVQQELKVNFVPDLYLQRRIWILDILRRESITRVLDVGCGEGQQILNPLSQPAPWLSPPPPSILPPPSSSNTNTNEENNSNSPSSIYNNNGIPNLHTSHLYGLDISKEDLEFASRETAPPNLPNPEDKTSTWNYYTLQQRWEPLEVKLWKGGLEVINEEFVGIECIVSTEVIEHLPPEIFPAFAPMLLGVYHPSFLLITTPSYTYNARFTAPNAPKSARRGYSDPTGRTDRIFRHSDHKFEWTTEEFREWCEKTAKEWGYDVEISGIGRAVEPDPWNREDELGDATAVACFKKSAKQEDADRENRGREVIKKLGLADAPHELFVTHIHQPETSTQKPKPLAEITSLVIQQFERYRETFMGVEELWFEPKIASACGGWIEFLVSAVEECDDLDLVREDMGNDRSRWKVQRLGVMPVTPPWLRERGSSIDYIPPDWIPEEETMCEPEYDSNPEESAGGEGDVSWGGSEEDTEEERSYEWNNAFLQLKEHANEDAWNSFEAENGKHWASKQDMTSPASSTAGWDGDASESTL